MRILKPHEYPYVVDESVTDEPLVKETDAWFAPFHAAVTTGLVDGRLPHGRGGIRGGTVSELPYSSKRDSGDTG